MSDMVCPSCKGNGIDPSVREILLASIENDRFWQSCTPQTLRDNLIQGEPLSSETQYLTCGQCNGRRVIDTEQTIDMGHETLAICQCAHSKPLHFNNGQCVAVGCGCKGFTFEGTR